LTDLAAKRVPHQILLGQTEQLAFEKLKAELCTSTNEYLAIVDFKKPFAIHIDASNNAVGGVLIQPRLHQNSNCFY